MTAPPANWSYPTAVRFGPGRIKELPDACRVAGISRPLLVTDAGLAKLPITQRAIDLLKAAGFPVAPQSRGGGPSRHHPASLERDGDGARLLHRWRFP